MFNFDDGNLFNFRNASISGLTLTGGDVSGDGGAVASQENLTITGCTLSGNAAGRAGGGVYCFGDLHVANSTIASSAQATRATTIQARRERDASVTYLMPANFARPACARPMSIMLL